MAFLAGLLEMGVKHMVPEAIGRTQFYVLRQQFAVTIARVSIFDYHRL
jgi:hypothetical protein